MKLTASLTATPLIPFAVSNVAVLKQQIIQTAARMFFNVLLRRDSLCLSWREVHRVLVWVNVCWKRAAFGNIVFGVHRRNNRMVDEEWETSELLQLLVGCQDHQIKGYKEHTVYISVRNACKICTDKPESDLGKVLCLENNIKIEHKEVGCVDLSWINLCSYCNKWRILLNVLMGLLAL